METTTLNIPFLERNYISLMSLDVHISQVVCDQRFTHNKEFATTKEHYFLIRYGSTFTLSKRFQILYHFFWDPLIFLSLIVRQRNDLPSSHEVHSRSYSDSHGIEIDKWFPGHLVVLINLVIKCSFDSDYCFDFLPVLLCFLDFFLHGQRLQFS